MGLFDFFKKKSNEEWFEIYSPLNGKVIDLSEVPDDAFSQKMVGDGCAIDPAEGAICAPVSGDIGIFETNHAVTFETENGLELIVHFGVDTVELKGEGFKKLTDADSAKVGDKLVEYDLAFLKEKAPSVKTPVIIASMDAVEKIDVVAKGKDVKVGDLIMKVLLKK
ncbi:Glucose-specific phosphotransferase enzyme IIA component [Fusobacterium necrogenes]|uniref:Glucose-specific phosphotransferase enzyme IIA component n=1 Tax=Fusobacterium necrogenes TaxID=858 RepID=A0A377GXH3_9FUSO|nr:PTS glucose transporter subunit IIA [Fusobacterium necrogenes]STO31304.1 Glucose-specific phosphotransferase enzyme IIA component [Fusobacterium necrogenes]